MDDITSKKANTYLEATNQDLLTVFAKVKALEVLSRLILPYLDLTIVKYCQVANIVGNKLVLLVANGSVATQLRFQTTDLLAKFKQQPELKHIQEIQCKVRPVSAPAPSAARTSKQHKMSPLSPETAEVVREIAQTVDDPKLRAALEKIAEHTDQLSKTID